MREKQPQHISEALSLELARTHFFPLAHAFGFGGIAGLYLLATVGITLIGLAAIAAASLLVLRLLAAAGSNRRLKSAKP